MEPMKIEIAPNNFTDLETNEVGTEDSIQNLFAS